MRSLKVLAVLAAAFVVAAPVLAQSFSEEFEDITTLAGAGWAFDNNSTGIGLLSWAPSTESLTPRDEFDFQGNTAVFPAYSGAGYIADNYNATTGASTISDWLITPAVTIQNGDTVSFWTRGPTGSNFPDRLQVRMSLNGSSVNCGTLPEDVGDFTTLLLEINPTLAVGGYPQVWTQYTITISGVAAPTPGRFAFRYYVTNGGPSGTNSDYIGVDLFDYTAAGGQAASIVMTKTVGTVPGVCATTDTITVATGTDVYYCYEVENTGTVTFNFHDLVDDQLGTLLDAFPYTLAPGASAFWLEPDTATAPVVNTATWTAVDAIGGYIVDNTIPLNFVDISGTGTALNLTDDGEANITSPFPFTFFDSTSTNMRVGNNGGILFGVTTGELGFTNSTLPSSTLGMAMLPLWDDIGYATGNVYWQVLGAAPNRTLIVEWDRPHLSTTDRGTWEVILYEGTNVVEVHYQDTDFGNASYNFGVSATVGLNKDASTALQYSYNQPVILSGLAIRYTPTVEQEASSSDTATVNLSDPDITVNPASLLSVQMVGQVIDLPLTIGNVGVADLTWTLEEEPVEHNFPTIEQTPWTWDPLQAAELASEQPESKIPDWYPGPVSWFGPDAILYDNGPLVTHPGGGGGGADASALQTALGMGTYGTSCSLGTGYRVADDLTVTDPAGWAIDTITFFTYQTGSSTTSTITSLNLQIWDGPPNNPASSVVWGNTTTNVLTSTTWTNIYRVLDTALLDSTRPIMTAVAAVNHTLPAGTYWLDWQVGGSLGSGPWAPAVTILGQTTTGNAMQQTVSTGVWANFIDVGPQGLPFIIEGQPAICGNMADVPWLSASPTAGTINPSGNQVVDVSFDSTGLALGLYEATLCVFSNDPDEPIVPVPVTMEVVIPVELMGISVE